MRQPAGSPEPFPADPGCAAFGPDRPDLSDLRELLRERRTVSEIAEYLCREIDEVEPKIAELREALA
jgi:hypothetical protein